VSTVETVRGPVDVAELGPTLMHEHVFVLQPEALQSYGHVWGESYWDEEVRVRDAIEKLGALRAAGIRTLVDPTAPGLGRCIPRIQRIAAEVDLNIVVATGVYAFLELPNFLCYRPVDAISDCSSARSATASTTPGSGRPSSSAAWNSTASSVTSHGFSTRSRPPRSRPTCRSWSTPTRAQARRRSLSKP
jgi:predicted metal-dependent phosphotriesterase family hydrolase